MSLARVRVMAANSAVLLCLAGGVSLRAQSQAPLAIPTTPDYSAAAKIFPHLSAPYKSRAVPDAVLSNAPGGALEVRDGKLRLSMAQVVAAVVQNNLTVA